MTQDNKTIYTFLRGIGAKLWRHRRRKSVEPYVMVGIAYAQCSTYQIIEGDRVAVYLNSEGQLYVRHEDEFTDGRFYEAKE